MPLFDSIRTSRRDNIQVETSEITNYLFISSLLNVDIRKLIIYNIRLVCKCGLRMRGQDYPYYD